MHQYKFRKILLVLSIPVTFLIICIGTSLGSSNINIWNIISIILNKVFGLPLISGIEEQDISIIGIIRFPRVLLAFIVGSALSVSGAIMQSVLKNPLASPFTLGVSTGAGLGVALYTIFGLSIPFLGDMAFPIIGFLCSLITVCAVLSFANKVDRGISNSTIVLSGIVFSLFANAVLTTISAMNQESMVVVINWQLGSFSMKGWSYFLIGIPFFIIGIIISLKYTKELDVLSFGEDQAKSMGVEVKKVKKMLFLATAILTGSAVAISGTIGFVDLIIPHVVRKFFGSNHKWVIPMCVIFGGSLMVVTDLVSRTIISPSELPVGAITALVGAPFFAYLYFNRRVK